MTPVEQNIRAFVARNEQKLGRKIHEPFRENEIQKMIRRRDPAINTPPPGYEQPQRRAGSLQAKIIDADKPLSQLITDEQRELIAKRRAICEPCENNQGLFKVSVRCAQCGCAGLSLIGGTCPEKKW